MKTNIKLPHLLLELSGRLLLLLCPCKTYEKVVDKKTKYEGVVKIFIRIKEWIFWLIIESENRSVHDCWFRRKMAQLCHWKKIRTVTRFGCVGFSMYACVLCPKCDNFACLHTRHGQNERHLKRYDLFLAIIGIFCKSIVGPLRRKDKNNYLSNQTWA